MKNLGFCLTIMFAALFVSAPVLAHHGETNYDTEKLVTIKGDRDEFPIHQSARATFSGREE